MIYESLREIADRFDVFLFDAYGVFWGGSGFYSGSKEVMSELVRQGKTVVVVSNTTQLHDDMVAGYAKKGLLEGRNCHYFVSSGEVLRRDLLRQNISFESCPEPRRFYVVGLPHNKAFDGTVYQQVESPEEADFVYCGVPYLFAGDVEKYPQYQDNYWPVKCDENGQVSVWDTTVAEPFAAVVRKATALGLSVLNANPDFMAQEGHPLVSDHAAVFVVRNGSVAEMFRQSGCEVLEYGKPHRNIYDYTFEMLEEHGISVVPERVCMVGDTVRTDIKGAVNCGIVPVLCLKTGVTALESSKGNSLKSLCEKEKIDVQQIILINSVGGSD